MGEKLKFVEAALVPGANISALCEEHGISRQTGHKWLRRYRELGYRGLVEQSRRPHSSASLGEEIVAAILELRSKHPSWGPAIIARVLGRRFGSDGPARSTVARVLKRLGRIKRRRPAVRVWTVDGKPQFEVQAPNDLWTIDFKGWWRSTDGQRCEPFTVRDAYSRFVLAVELVASTRASVVRRILERLFRKHGVPRAIQCDNGTPWVHMRSRGGLTHLSVWLVSLGIRLIRSRVACPQDNGGHERMHRDLSELQLSPASTRRKQQHGADRWIVDFNEVRPHQALGGKTPAEVYRVRERRPVAPRLPTYPPGWITRHVQSGGSICVDGDKVPIGAPLRGKLVGLRHESGLRWHAYFFEVDLGIVEIASLGDVHSIQDALPNPNEGNPAAAVSA